MTGNEYWLAHYLSEFTYIGMFLILFIGGFGFPFPEEIVLVLAGYGIYAEVTQPWLTILACVAGALAGDQVMYWIGRWWVAVPMKWRWTRRVISRRKMVRIQRRFRKYGYKFLFFCRLITGLRMAAFFLCGAMKMSAFRFTLIDIGATIFAVLFYTYLGCHFGSNITAAIEYVRRANEHVAVFSFIFVVALIVGYAIYVWRTPAVRRPPQRIRDMVQRKAEKAAKVGEKNEM